MNCGKFLDKLAESEDTVAITYFGNPNPDIVASAFTLGKLFEAKNVEFDFVFEGKIARPENQLLINYLDMSIKNLNEADFENYNHVSLVGCNPGNFTDNLNDEIRGELVNKLISVQDNQGDGGSVSESLKSKDVYVDITPDCGACSTILAECIENSEVEFDEKTATGLYYGLHTVTEGLLRWFTTEDFRQVINYVDKVDRAVLKENLSSNMTSETLEVINRVTGEDYHETRGTYKFANAGPFFDKNQSDLSIVADLLMKEEGIEGIVIAGIDLDEKLVIGSVRYTGSRYSAEKIARTIADGMGSGGGHVEMGVFQVQPGVLLDTLHKQSTQDALMDSIKERFFNIVGKNS